MGKKIKVLLCTYHETDCGLDNLYDGLCRVLGPENVYEYPEKPYLHGEPGRKYSWFPLFFDWPSYADEDKKLEMLEAGKFDVVLFSNRVLLHIMHAVDAPIRDKYIRLYEILKGRTVYVLDMNDGLAVDEVLFSDFNVPLYFKRDVKKDAVQDSRIVPLNFCYSEKYIPRDINTNRSNMVFWLGRGYCGRAEYLDVCKELSPQSDIVVTGKAEIICGQAEYSQRLGNSKIGINLPAYGFNDMRCYEIPAHRVLLFSKKMPVYIEDDYTDMDNAVFFNSIDDMRDKLKFLLSHEDFVDKARIKGYKHMLKHHTTRVRAKQLLDKICSHTGT